MKKLIYLSLISGLLSCLAGCQKEFLQKPETTGNVTAESVFATRNTAEAAVAGAYREVLVQNLWNGRAIDNGTLSGISGEMSYGEPWATLAQYVSSGFLPTPYQNNKAQSSDNFFDSFSSVRKSYLVQENIDKVADMDATQKGYVKAEMTGLVAYRYMGMMIHYGGVPLVTKSLSPSDDLNIPRATLQATLDKIVEWSTAAAAGLPDRWDDKYAGRLTKGAALAIKAKALIYAARPLFNSATPYLSLGANSNLICFGSANAQRWTDAIAANEAVITWANANGYGVINTGGSTGVPNPNAFADYGTATSTPNNKEVLLAFKLDENGSKLFKFYNPTSGNGERYLIARYGMLTNFLTNYYKADGTDQVWPTGGASLPYSDYSTKMQAMEPRFKADNYAHGIDSWNNPGNSLWSYANASKGSNNPSNSEGTRGHGVAQSTKFYYLAGSRVWFEYPLFRMPEFYLNLAEAYNETGNSQKALENLNVVHNRAGLPSITVTDQATLRRIIQREWAVEFYNENHRFFDVKHWKLDNIGNGIMGGGMREFQFTTNGQNDRLPQNLLTYFDKETYTAYWNPKMFLDPFPQEEINKGILIQNPGY
ncbi:MAG: RagB/SusD family nutrient uptake outer membrane protein [Pedobacter sp.]|nr:MAG: RagB/SusD family nutrient uptake outer membrane protein [Pedobacter sp.]